MENVWNNILLVECKMMKPCSPIILTGGGVTGTVAVQWLKLPALKVGDCGFKTHFGFQVSKKQNVSSPLNSKDVDPP